MTRKGARLEKEVPVIVVIDGIVVTVTAEDDFKHCGNIYDAVIDAINHTNEPRVLPPAKGYVYSFVLFMPLIISALVVAVGLAAGMVLFNTQDSQFYYYADLAGMYVMPSIAVVLYVLLLSKLHSCRKYYRTNWEEHFWLSVL